MHETLSRLAPLPEMPEPEPEPEPVQEPSPTPPPIEWIETDPDKYGVF